MHSNRQHNSHSSMITTIANSTKWRSKRTCDRTVPLTIPARIRAKIIPCVTRILSKPADKQNVCCSQLSHHQALRNGTRWTKMLFIWKISNIRTFNNAGLTNPFRLLVLHLWQYHLIQAARCKLQAAMPFQKSWNP